MREDGTQNPDLHHPLPLTQAGSSGHGIEEHRRKKFSITVTDVTKPYQLWTKCPMSRWRAPVNPARVRDTRIPILEYLECCENICRLRGCPCGGIELHCTYQVSYVGSFEDVCMWEEFSGVDFRSTSSGSSPLGRILFQISLDANPPGCFQRLVSSFVKPKNKKSPGRHIPAHVFSHVEDEATERRIVRDEGSDHDVLDVNVVQLQLRRMWREWWYRVVTSV